MPGYGGIPARLGLKTRLIRAVASQFQAERAMLAFEVKKESSLEETLV